VDLPFQRFNWRYHPSDGDQVSKNNLPLSPFPVSDVAISMFRFENPLQNLNRSSLLLSGFTDSNVPPSLFSRSRISNVHGRIFVRSKRYFENLILKTRSLTHLKTITDEQLERHLRRSVESFTLDDLDHDVGDQAQLLLLVFGTFHGSYRYSRFLLVSSSRPRQRLCRTHSSCSRPHHSRYLDHIFNQRRRRPVSFPIIQGQQLVRLVYFGHGVVTFGKEGELGSGSRPNLVGSEQCSVLD
jgi:hypothetical protein